MIFQGGGDEDARSLILKEKISNKVLEVFVLFLLILLFYLCFYVLQEDKI
jgi:hypothetical protein